MKVCRHCGATKGACEFPKNPKCHDGLGSWCRTCHSAAARAAYHRHRERYAERSRDRYRLRRAATQRERAMAAEERRLSRLVGKSCVVPWGSCAECHGPLVRRNGKRYCSIACKSTVSNRAYRAHKVRHAGTGSCLECGVTITTERGRKFCSDAHARRYHASNGRHRLRSAIASSAERVSRFVVFERDQWVCGICGLYVDRSLSGREMLGPTLDHIIPLARGGTHTYANLQTAHLLCNKAKGAKVAA